MKLLALEKRLVTTLEEVALQAVRRGTPLERAVADIRVVSADPVLLGLAAGRARGRCVAIPLFHSVGEETAALLVAAGADESVSTKTASSVEKKLRKQLRRE